MTKILFLIHDLGHGGAEKVLINLANHIDKDKFDVTVLSLFSGGVNEQFLSPEVRLLCGHRWMLPGNSHLMKLFSPEMLFRYYIKEKYDVIVSYLEGPSARIVSGCPIDGTKLVSWIHCTMENEKCISTGFRNLNEAKQCYQRFDASVFVSTEVRDAFLKLIRTKNPVVLYNTVESSIIRTKSFEKPDESLFSGSANTQKLVGVGKLMPNKGFDRLLRIHRRLCLEDQLPIHTYLLGEGAEREKLEQWVNEQGLESSVTFLGYQTNPYKYVAACDLFVCASHAEGFSTAATEALIVGTPVITTRVSGMEEMLGSNGEYGIITENN